MSMEAILFALAAGTGVSLFGLIALAIYIVKFKSDVYEYVEENETNIGKLLNLPARTGQLETAFGNCNRLLINHGKRLDVLDKQKITANSMRVASKQSREVGKKLRQAAKPTGKPAKPEIPVTNADDAGSGP